MKPSYNDKPFYLTVVVFINLILITFLVPEFEIFGVRFKKLDIFSEFRSDKIENKNLAEDKILESISDTVTSENLNSNKLEFKKFSELNNIINFQNLWEALKNNEHIDGQIRIGYYGDSQIEGDIVTGDLRLMLQKKFGGYGVGLTPIYAVDGNFRNQIKIVSEKDDFKVSSIINSTKDSDLSISGFSYQPKNDCNVSYQVIHKDEEFSRIKLLYKILDSAKSPIFFINEKQIELDTSIKSFSKYSHNFETKQKQLNLGFFSDSYKLYGISFESNNGIFVDNFSLRGHSGKTLNAISWGNLNYFNNNFNYRLFVFQFGPNIYTDKITDYSFYESSMIKVINYFKKIFPKADFLIVSIGDKSKKIDEKFVTDENIFNLLKAQYNIAKKTNSSFINLFKLMGGYNSMPKWVERGLAANDYIHLSRAGGRKIAKLIYEYIVQKNQSQNK